MRKKILGLVFLVLLGGNIVFFTLWQSGKKASDTTLLQKKYPYLSKRVLTEFPQDILINFLDLRTDLRGSTTSYGNDFAMYFEYLPTGTSIGINEKDDFYAASLFKLPVVMAYYHQRERLKQTNDPILTIRQQDLDQEFGNLWEKGVGYKLPTSEAIRLSLEESDNTAIKMLVPQVSKQDFMSVYEALDIDLSDDKNGVSLTTKGYSSILKALYFSSVLQKDDSEKILAMLTNTKFIDKLPAGVPDSIDVAHKIGVYNKNGQDEAYSDCGIVYVPRRPYVLCMLSKGDEQTARDRMQLVSKKVYDYVSSTN